MTVVHYTQRRPAPIDPGQRSASRDREWRARRPSVTILSNYGSVKQRTLRAVLRVSDPATREDQPAIGGRGSRNAVISLQDCIALCGLTEDEILAIAEHEHVPEIVAAGLGSTLLQRAHGSQDVCRMIIDDIGAARLRGDMRHMSELITCLRHFLDQHPEARDSVRSGFS